MPTRRHELYDGETHQVIVSQTPMSREERLLRAVCEYLGIDAERAEDAALEAFVERYYDEKREQEGRCCCACCEWD